MSDNNRLDGLKDLLEDKPYLTFAEYMAYALYHPSRGYYMQDPSPVGRDFVTAPMLSPLFSKAILNWLLKKQQHHIIELGAGTGILAQQLLKSTEIKSYSILDMNPKASQHIEDVRCEWIYQLRDNDGVIIANELLDALPFRRFCIQEDGLYEFVIKGSPFEVILIKTDEVLPLCITSQLQLLPPPYIFEYCDYSVIFEQLKDFRGTVLLMDYGYAEDYFHPDRALGTMMCYRNHHSIPFSLSETGFIDITCAVNWTLLEVIAKEYGFKLQHIGPQSDFILAMVEDDFDATSARLIYEHEMGQFVKVVELCAI